MKKAFKYRLYPTRKQERLLFWTLARCREVYNAALTSRRDAYHFHVRQHPNYYDPDTRIRLTKELTVSLNGQKRDATAKRLPEHIARSRTSVGTSITKLPGCSLTSIG